MNIIIKCDSKYWSNITRLWNEHHNTQYHKIARFWTSQYIKYIFRFIEYNKVLSMYFSVLSLLGKGRGLKGVQIWITSKDEYFAPVWLILAHRFWRRRFFWYPQCIFVTLLSSPFGKGHILHLLNSNPLYSGVLCTIFAWIELSILEEKIFRFHQYILAFWVDSRSK